jgi:predicted secreted protein
MSNAKLGYSTTISRNGNLIGQLTSITAPSLSADSVDVSTLDSADGYREFIQGMRDGGEVAIEGKFYPGDTNGQAGLYDDFNNGTLQTFVITFPTSMGASWSFSGIVTAIESEIPFDDAIGFSATIKVSGKPLLGVTASTGVSAFVLRNAADDGDATAVNYLPNFAIGTYYYGVTYTTESAVRVKVTAASHTIKIYIDGVYVESVSSGVSSSQISISADSSKQVRVEVYETAKTPKNYYFVLARIS